MYAWIPMLFTVAIVARGILKPLPRDRGAQLLSMLLRLMLYGFLVAGVWIAYLAILSWRP